MPQRRQSSQLPTALGFLMPNFLGFLLFTAGPVAVSIGAAFTNWNLNRTIPFHFTGIENFRELFVDESFWLYFINTGYLMLGMPVAIFGSLLLAILLSRPMRGMSAYRTFFYLPSITSGVALMILWKVLYNPDFGPINVILSWGMSHLGIEQLAHWAGWGTLSAPHWLQSTHNLLGIAVEHVQLTARQWGLGARDAIILMGIWVAIGGNNMLLYLAALTNVPADLYEAAAIDGAGRWKTFWNVTWPQLMPTTFFIVIMSIIGGLQGGFEQAKVMTNGGPAGTTTTLSFYIYTKAFEEYQIGYASAVALVLFTAIFAMTMLSWRFGGRNLE